MRRFMDRAQGREVPSSYALHPRHLRGRNRLDNRSFCEYANRRRPIGTDRTLRCHEGSLHDSCGCRTFRGSVHAIRVFVPHGGFFDCFRHLSSGARLLHDRRVGCFFSSKGKVFVGSLRLVDVCVHASSQRFRSSLRLFGRSRFSGDSPRVEGHIVHRVFRDASLGRGCPCLPGARANWRGVLVLCRPVPGFDSLRTLRLFRPDHRIRTSGTVVPDGVRVRPARLWLPRFRPQVSFSGT